MVNVNGLDNTQRAQGSQLRFDERVIGNKTDVTFDAARFSEFFDTAASAALNSGSTTTQGAALKVSTTTDKTGNFTGVDSGIANEMRNSSVDWSTVPDSVIAQVSQLENAVINQLVHTPDGDMLAKLVNQMTGVSAAKTQIQNIRDNFSEAGAATLKLFGVDNKTDLEVILKKFEDFFDKGDGSLISKLTGIDIGKLNLSLQGNELSKSAFSDLEVNINNGTEAMKFIADASDIVRDYNMGNSTNLNLKVETLNTNFSDFLAKNGFERNNVI